ncbi:hypothetical protein J4461_04420, partial [Candidatus Pacearchaeota archaeon]|nr:hypothetical protein [Candidatus Pacearchaeota archaeon]
MKLSALIFALCMGIGMVSVVSAIDTQINVHTWSGNEVSIFVLDGSQVYYLLQSYYLNSNLSGDVSAFYTGDASKLSFRVIVKREKEQLLSEKFGPYDAGKTIYIQAIPGNLSSQAIPGNLSSDYREFWKNSTPEVTIATNVSNMTVANNSTFNNTNISETAGKENSNKSPKNKSLSGLAVIDLKSSTFRTISLIILGIIILGFMVFLGFRVAPSLMQNIGGSKQPHVPAHMSAAELERRLRQSEYKLQNAEKEINKLK